MAKKEIATEQKIEFTPVKENETYLVITKDCKHFKGGLEYEVSGNVANALLKKGIVTLKK
jgi:hypothetical protein